MPFWVLALNTSDDERLVIRFSAGICVEDPATSHSPRRPGTPQALTQDYSVDVAARITCRLLAFYYRPRLRTSMSQKLRLGSCYSQLTTFLGR